MIDPFGFIEEFREMNEGLCTKLDEIISGLGDVVAVLRDIKNSSSPYGDGR